MVTVTAGPAAGVGATASVVQAGYIAFVTLTTGTAPTLGVLATVTLETAAVVMDIQPTNDVPVNAALALGPVTASYTTEVVSASEGTPLAPNTSYQFIVNCGMPVA